MWERLIESASGTRAAVGFATASVAATAFYVASSLPPLLYSDQAESLAETQLVRANPVAPTVGAVIVTHRSCFTDALGKPVCTEVPQAVPYQVTERIEVTYPRRVLTGTQFTVEVRYFWDVDPPSARAGALAKLVPPGGQSVSLSGAGFTVKPAEERVLPGGEENPKSVSFTVSMKDIADVAVLLLLPQKLSLTHSPRIAVTDADGRTVVYDELRDIELPIEIRTYAPVPESVARTVSWFGLVVAPLGLWEFIRYLLKSHWQRRQERIRKKEEEQRPRIWTP